MNNTITVNANPINLNTQHSIVNGNTNDVAVNNCGNIVDNIDKSITFAVTVHTTLPIRTASQGVSFALYTPTLPSSYLLKA